MRHLEVLTALLLCLWIGLRIARDSLRRWVNRPLTPVDERLTQVDLELLLSEPRCGRLGVTVESAVYASGPVEEEVSPSRIGYEPAAAAVESGRAADGISSPPSRPVWDTQRRPS